MKVGEKNQQEIIKQEEYSKKKRGMSKIDVTQVKKKKIYMKGKTKLKFAPPKWQKIYWKKLNRESGTCVSIRKISVLHY